MALWQKIRKGTGQKMVKRRINLKSDNIKLDIGCKNHKKKGFAGLDILDYGQEILWDVIEGLPLPDNSVAEISITHFIEHIEMKDIAQLFVEMYRICKGGAIIDIAVPHLDHIEAYYLGHVSYWNEIRIKGLIRSYANNFSIVEILKKGFELIVKLKVNK